MSIDDKTMYEQVYERARKGFLSVLGMASTRVRPCCGRRAVVACQRWQIGAKGAVLGSYNTSASPAQRVPMRLLQMLAEAIAGDTSGDEEGCRGVALSS